MRIARNAIFSLGLLAATFLAGYWLRQPEPAVQAAPGKPLYYRCPMHPGVKSDKPGAASCCGMDLVAVFAEDQNAAGARPPGEVRISLEKQQLIGLQTAKVVRTSGSRVIHALGRVVVDETRIHRVTAQIEGVVRGVSNYAGGSLVNKEDLLANYFVSTPELYSAVQAYFVAMSLQDQRAALNPNEGALDASRAQIRLTEELLQTYGMTEKQIHELAKTRQVTRDIQFRSPVSGLVLARNAALGQRLERGAEVFRIADLSRVWIVADVFENDSQLIPSGSAARAEYQGRSYRASMSDARQFDPASRTLKVRLELDNPGFVLRPDMFVDVEFDVKEPDGISIPVDALVDAGRRRVVFVSSGEGTFQPREVTVGSRYGDRVQIIGGLVEGESVVVSGLFLLDSESRLRMAAAGPVPAAVKPPAASVDPVCGMEVGSAALVSQYEGRSYSFCSKTCKAKFDAKPSLYVKDKHS
jgi:membrane fusion protein, copper/silver efflux system